MAADNEAANALIRILTSGTKIQHPIGENERHSLTGVVTADDVILPKTGSEAESCTRFRLYPNARIPGEYYVFGREALSDKPPRPWKPEEVLHRGAVAGIGNDRPIVRVYFKHGAEITYVTNQTLRIGVSSLPGRNRPGAGGTGGCSCGGGPGGPSSYCFPCEECETGWATSPNSNHIPYDCVDSCDPEG